jgi:hypothetical protein
VKMSTRSIVTVVGMIVSCALTFAPSAYAHEQWQHEGHRKEFSTQERQAWVKNHIDKEAARLEIKASQQSLWEAYAAAKLDLIDSFGPGMKPSDTDDLDAATVAHKHAEHAAEIAQKLSKLADATDKLQAVLSEDQRKVLNQIVKHPGFHHRDHPGQMSGDQSSKAVTKPAAKAVSEKSKQPQ